MGVVATEGVLGRHTLSQLENRDETEENLSATMKHSDCHNPQHESIGEQPYTDEQLEEIAKAKGGKPNSSSEFTAQIIESETSSYPVLPSKSKVPQKRNASIMQQVSQSNEEKLTETVKIEGLHKVLVNGAFSAQDTDRQQI